MEFKLDTSELFPFKRRTNKPFNPEHLELDDEILLASFIIGRQYKQKDADILVQLACVYCVDTV